MLYNISLKSLDNGADLLKIGFGDPATNAEIVPFVDGIAPEGNGNLLLVNGPASLPVAAVIVHKYAHVYGTIAFFDPKLNGYVVSISHSDDYVLGQIIPA